MHLTKEYPQASYKVAFISPFQAKGSPKECVRHIKLPDYYFLVNWDPALSPMAKGQDFLLQSSSSSIEAKKVFASPGSVHKDPFIPPIGVKQQSDNIVCTSPGKCSPASNSSASVITVSNLGELNVILLAI